MKINIKQFGDIHFNDDFKEEKLDKIKRVICDSRTDYALFTGDLIHTNDFIRTNIFKRNLLLRWIESIAKEHGLVMVQGNHDLFSENKKKDGWKCDYDFSFWKEVASIDGVTLLSGNNSYEDDAVLIKGINESYPYYENLLNRENKAELIDMFWESKKYITSTNPDKLNIFLHHSPIFLTDDDIKSYLERYDLVLSGHMHNGCVLPFMEKILPEHVGIINPEGKLLPDNTRGTIDISDTTKLIITGGISKIVKSKPIYRTLNELFPMEVTNIDYNTEDKTSVVRTIRFK